MPAQAGTTFTPVMRSPRSVDIDITANCNLRCRYCYFFDNPAVAYHDLPTAEWLEFFDELGRNNVMDVCVAGGEPFTRSDLPILLERVVRNRMRFSLLSNGSLIDDEVASFLAGTHRCDFVQISLDGSKPDTHDIFRGSGSFVGAIRGIRTLLRHRVPVTVRVTIHRHNVADLQNIAHLLLDELGLPGFTTNAAGYLGACRRNADSVLLTVEDREAAMRTLLALAERYAGRIDAQAGPLADARRWRQMEDAARAGDPPLANGGRLSGCGCPSSRIAVRADGTIVPCSMLAHIELGRINRDSLTQVWGSSPALNALRQRSELALAGFDHCAGCCYTDYCTGNCPGLAYTMTGSVDHPSPDACLRDYLAAGGCVPPAAPAIAPIGTLS